MKTKTQPNKRNYLLEVKENAKQNNMLGTAIAVSKLNVEFDMSAKEIKEELEKINCTISLPHVYNYLRLAKLPAKVQAHIKAERINPTDVLAELHKHQSDAELITIVDKIVAAKERESKVKSQKQREQKVQSIQNKILAFFENNGISPSKKNIESLNKITGKYAI